MSVVVDANCVVSALIRDGATRRALFTTDARIIAPRFLQEEVWKHASMIRERSGLSQGEFKALVQSLFGRIEWVGQDVLAPHLGRAWDALATADPMDVPYLACALAVDADAIWSHDKDFDTQGLVPRVPHPDAPIE